MGRSLHTEQFCLAAAFIIDVTDYPSEDDPGLSVT